MERAPAAAAQERWLSRLQEDKAVQRRYGDRHRWEGTGKAGIMLGVSSC